MENGLGGDRISYKLGICTECGQFLSFHFKKDGLEIRGICPHTNPLNNIHRNFSLGGRKKIILNLGVKQNMPKNADEEDKKIRSEIAKDWGITDDMLTGFVRSRIAAYKKEGKWKPNFDDEELEECLIEMVCDLGMGFEAHQGKFGLDSFLRVLHDQTTLSIDGEIERRKKIFKQEKEKMNE